LLFATRLLQAGPLASAVCELPIKFHEGLLWLEVTVPQSSQPLHFLLDSGASASVLNLSTAKRLGVKLGQRVDVRGVGSRTDGFWPQRLEAMAGTVSLPKEYLAVDLAELSRACDCGVDGLLGADFFRERVVQIDFVASKIRLLPSSDAAGDASVVDLKRSRMALLAAVRVNDGRPQWMRVDTGCTSALQWVMTGARRPDINRAVSIALTEVNIPTASTTVTLGAMKFDSIPTRLHPRPIFSDESGLLGNGLLCQFERVTIDAKHGRLILENRRAGN
jgi:predicted aspartyl protease